MRILVIEDDPETANYVVSGFKEEGHAVTLETDGRAGLLTALDGDFDAMVLDRMLPNRDGLSILAAARAAGVQTPVLLLSALGKVDDRVKGLRSGADDYLVKPFAFEELSARLDALLRRPAPQEDQTEITVGDLKIDLMSQKVTRRGRPIVLQPREYRLLCHLARNAGRVVTRTMLLENVWDFHFEPGTNLVESHMSRLRTKVDKPFGEPLIHTVRGSGYSLHE
ncbi:response regulator transcription factor [Ruegeria sp. AU67]|uniref:winged helix-turn-helix domain-containing protein n=1 Tax=Ruegeria sp. AU67 TaxID=2108530 RepID=UPI000D69F9FE|nr:response regulator transcription factor [Ruegeria sp. AU67]